AKQAEAISKATRGEIKLYSTQRKACCKTKEK
ncbi:putative KRR1 small subunit processome component protein, partial [Naja naja]